MRYVVGCVIVAATSIATADDLSPPPVEVEVKPPDVIVQLPAVPLFAVPSIVNGVHDVRELRVNGRAVVGTEIKVQGYITWIYDCVTDVMRPGKTRAQVQKAIDDDPTLCQRPKLHLAATRDANDDVALWVVDVPRAPNKLELRMLGKDELSKWPTPPKLALGDYVVLTGKFDYTSPHSERNSDGLLVFRAIDHVAPAANASAGVPLPAIKLVTPALPTPVPVTPVLPAVFNASKTALARANILFKNNKRTEAIVAYREAIATWNGNHLAWYGLGASAYENRDHKTAVDALEHATAIVPSSPVYQLVLGVAIYESIVADAREAQAKRDGRSASDVVPDLSTLNFQRALDHLLLAVSLEPRVWRAHYFIGRIMREGGHAREAADEFTKAIQANPREPGPFIALAELYRKWDLTDAAIATAKQGVASVTPPAGDLWFELGVALWEKHIDAEAIDALSKAIDLRADNVKARFQRGVAYIRVKQKAKAKADLQVVAASTDPTREFDRAIAQNLLLDLAAKP